MIRVRIDEAVPAVAGVVWAEGDDWSVPPGFEDRLARVLDARRGEPDAAEEAVRSAARDMLRNGRYKPTGRGKPASEYLVRAAREDAFPRINPVVDICNLVSLESLLPISLWDIDKAGADDYLVRLGSEGESFVFNQAGQEIDVTDLVVGCRVVGDVRGEPIVNPVKDRLLTKTDDGTRRVAALVYAPRASDAAWLGAIVEGFAGWLRDAGAGNRVGWGLASADRPYTP